MIVPIGLFVGVPAGLLLDSKLEKVRRRVKYGFGNLDDDISYCKRISQQDTANSGMDGEESKVGRCLCISIITSNRRNS